MDFPSDTNTLFGDVVSQFYPRGFLGIKLGWNIRPSWLMALKGQYLFRASKNSTHEKWHFEKRIDYTISEKTALDINFKTRNAYSTYRILIGLEYTFLKGVK